MLQARKRNFRPITRLGRQACFQVSRVSPRLRVKNGLRRYELILGRAMQSRTLALTRVEARLGSKISNTMSLREMPEERRVA